MKGEVKADVTAKERSKVAGCPGLSVRGVHPDALGPLQVQNTDKTALGFRSRHPQGQLNQTRVWRRGWDSNPLSLLKPRKLLILGSARIATTAQFAQVGYTSGTHHTQEVPFGVAA